MRKDTEILAEIRKTKVDLGLVKVDEESYRESLRRALSRRTGLEQHLKKLTDELDEVTEPPTPQVQPKQSAPLAPTAPKK